MNNFAVIIPAQEKNRHNELGDITSFGDTTLLEWKIAQCKEITGAPNIFVSSSSKKIQDYVRHTGVNFLYRDLDISYSDMINDAVNHIDAENIILISCMTPFMDYNVYDRMLNIFMKKKPNILVSVEKKTEYIFFRQKRLNFDDKFISRKYLDPIYITINGCFIFKKDRILNNDDFGVMLNNATFFEVDSFEATEIKDTNSYELTKELINLYFKRSLNYAQ
ncbi:hypothetical protein A3835_09080 [Campylobacter concisus]|jgi:hypothetical protein|uniref:MobA-like NTP transferase domain-containing protein n=1 Tax=Campylobacter concisus TaxID=199 RepID=A0A1X0U5D7_9BACT|nr:NTP transferase domain-containing protein [Campylobacter concisus]ORI09858.1 hypothetical protein A3835_09080 [Campylobacter concisus]